MKVTYIGKDPTECTRERRGAEEECDPIVLFAALIPHRKVKDDA